jgi:DmsE family decaheme c-type cytochrome
MAGAVLTLVLGFWLSANAAENPAANKPGSGDAVLKGDAVCTKCHDEGEAYPVLAIGKTKHGVRADSRTPTCTSCHGESKNHITRIEGQKERAKPDRTYGGMYLNTPAGDRVDRYFGRQGRATDTPVGDRNAACLSCHQGGKRMHWSGSTHESRDVGCTNCHQIHASHDRVRDKATQTEFCFSCHKETRAQVSRQSHHPLKEGKMACSDCHNPHGSAGQKQLQRETVVDTCYQCHMEKRGPFVRTHQPVQEDCTICHNPHGTNNANLLKQRQPFLCQQCHEPTSHRGQVGTLASTGNTATSGMVARGCTNCHTNIHGTNNPANVSNERTLRR